MGLFALTSKGAGCCLRVCSATAGLWAAWGCWKMCLPGANTQLFYHLFIALCWENNDCISECTFPMQTLPLNLLLSQRTLQGNNHSSQLPQTSWQGTRTPSSESRVSLLSRGRSPGPKVQLWGYIDLYTGLWIYLLDESSFSSSHFPHLFHKELNRSFQKLAK